jgi:hypothetical protein
MEPQADQTPVRVTGAHPMIPDPDRIRAPLRHGEVLIEPAAAKQEKYLLSISPGAAAAALPKSLQALCMQARKDLFDAAVGHAGIIGNHMPQEALLNKRWILTGHQVEFYHAGVWAKALFADRLARRVDGVAFDLLVDHDTLETPGFSVPTRNNGHWSRETICWTTGSALPVEFLNSPNRNLRRDWMEKILNRSAVLSDALNFEFDQLNKSDLPNFADWMSHARRQLEMKLKVEIWHVPCSNMCNGAAWAGFVLWWVLHAYTWVQAYNEVLGEYRKVNGINNPGRPMPDLAVNEKYLELPFWIYSQGSPKERLILERTSGRLLCGDKTVETASLLGSAELIEAAHELRDRLMQTGLVVRPRALTLTMYVRLFVADLFVHGIGGALYDRITDQFLQKVLGVETAYSCVSAGWLLPLEDYGGETWDAADAAVLYGLKHHLMHNPQLLGSGPGEKKADTEQLVTRRRQLIDQINLSLKLDRDQTGHSRGPNHSERADKFRELHKVNNQLLEIRRADIEAINGRITAALKASVDHGVTHWREYYYAMHTFESLERLKEAIGKS